MKKYIINDYAFIMMILFIIYNLILKDLKIGGLLYQIFMIVLIILNIIILIIFRKSIKYKGLIIVVSFLTWLLLLKDFLQYIFGISNMITLIIIGFMESNFIKVLSILITIFFMPLLFVYLLVFGTSLNEESGRNDIYDDMHYYCENNYEIYSFSAGAMDHFHYSIGKHYEFLDIDDLMLCTFGMTIFYIIYNKFKVI